VQACAAHQVRGDADRRWTGSRNELATTVPDGGRREEVLDRHFIGTSPPGGADRDQFGEADRDQFGEADRDQFGEADRGRVGEAAADQPDQPALTAAPCDGYNADIAAAAPTVEGAPPRPPPAGPVSGSVPMRRKERRVEPQELTVGVDFQRPSQARIYDYLLGGSHNFAVDRAAARQLIAMVPDVVLVAHANRAFLRRAVQFLVGAGIRQFLDIGSGVPTSCNVHEIAQHAAPESRVAYVDIDPVAVADGRRILAGNDRATVIQEDLRRPEHILGHSEVRELIDFARPVGVLLVSVLHFIADADGPETIVATLRDAVPSGSYLVLSHVTSDRRPATVAAVTAANERGSGFAMARTAAEVGRFCAGFDLVEPGLVTVERWRPECPEDLDDRELLCLHASVGRKP
jgi:hypothetical protein